MYFSVTEPTASEAAVVVEVPHAGLRVDPLSMATLAAPVRSLGLDADLYVDELYRDAPAHGATVLSSQVSRYVCDLNRAEDNIDPLTAVGGLAQSAPHGLIWRETTEGQRALTGTLPRRELERRLQEFYRPYHQKLQALLDAKLRRFGFVVLLAAHSMPGRGRRGHRDPGRARADVVPGSRDFTTADREVIETPARLARARGWRVSHDDPYRGGFTTAHYGQPQAGQHAVQVELARPLYMDESTLEPLEPGFGETRAYCSEVVQQLARWRPGQ